MFLDHTQRCTTVGRTPLDEWSASRRDLYLTTHDTHNRQISMLPVGFEPTISAGERLRTLPPPHSHGNQKLQWQFDGLLIMGIIMPETCWAVSVRQSNKILRLTVASSWVFYLSDWRCTELQTTIPKFTLQEMWLKKMDSLLNKWNFHPHLNSKLKELAVGMTMSIRRLFSRNSLFLNIPSRVINMQTVACPRPPPHPHPSPSFIVCQGFAVACVLN